MASIFPYNMPRESFSMARALTSMFSPIYPSWNVTARVLWQSNTVVFKMAGFTRVTGCVWWMCPPPPPPTPRFLPRLLIDNACDSVATPLSLALSGLSAGIRVNGFEIRARAISRFTTRLIRSRLSKRTNRFLDLFRLGLIWVPFGANHSFKIFRLLMLDWPRSVIRRNCKENVINYWKISITAGVVV